MTYYIYNNENTRQSKKPRQRILPRDQQFLAVTDQKWGTFSAHIFDSFISESRFYVRYLINVVWIKLTETFIGLDGSICCPQTCISLIIALTVLSQISSGHLSFLKWHKCLNVLPYFLIFPKHIFYLCSPYFRLETQKVSYLIYLTFLIVKACDSRPNALLSLHRSCWWKMPCGNDKFYYHWEGLLWMCFCLCLVESWGYGVQPCLQSSRIHFKHTCGCMSPPIKLLCGTTDKVVFFQILTRARSLKFSVQLRRHLSLSWKYCHRKYRLVLPLQLHWRVRNVSMTMQFMMLTGTVVSSLILSFSAWE